MKPRAMVMQGKTTSKSDEAYNLIKARIEQGIYVPGYRIVQAPIAHELNISQVPVREAIKKLEAEGLITFERNVGAQVALIKETEYLHTMQTLALVEGFATALAAEKMSSLQLQKAREINEEMKQSLNNFDPSGFTELNLKFHSALFESCQNPHVLELVQRGWNRMRVLRNSSFSFVPGRAGESVAEHEELLRLIEQKAGSQEIEFFAREHRLKTLRAVLKHSGGLERKSSDATHEA